MAFPHMLAAANAPEFSPLMAGGFTAMMVLSVAVASKVGRHLRVFGGRVNAGAFALPDLVVITFLVVWLGGAAVQSFFTERAIPDEGDIMFNAIFLAVLVGGLCVFLRVRGVRLPALLGLRAVTWWKVVPFALVLLVGLYPLFLYAFAVSTTMVELVGKEVVPQAPAEFFQESVRSANTRAILLTVVFTAMVAPLAEEFIFRGYLHGVLKRFCGGLTAAFVTSAIFALVHVNLVTMLPLFVVGLAFTAAYELTGSLCVNVAMHALFNLTNLVVMYHVSSAPAP